jgi:predicted transcriptional regulator
MSSENKMEQMAPNLGEVSTVNIRRKPRTYEEILKFDVQILLMRTNEHLLEKQIAYKLNVPLYFVPNAINRLRKHGEIETPSFKNKKTIKTSSEKQTLTQQIKDFKEKLPKCNNKTARRYFNVYSMLTCGNYLTEGEMAKQLNVPEHIIFSTIKVLKDNGIIENSRKPRTLPSQNKLIDDAVKRLFLCGYGVDEMVKVLDGVQRTRICQAINWLKSIGELPKGRNKILRK